MTLQDNTLGSETRMLSSGKVLHRYPNSNVIINPIPLTPSDYPLDVLGWYDASNPLSIDLSGGTIPSTWNDLTINGNNLVAVGLNDMNILSANGLPTINMIQNTRWDGIVDLPDGWQMAAAMRLSDGRGQQTVIGGTISTFVPIMHRNRGNTNVARYDNVNAPLNIHANGELRATNARGGCWTAIIDIPNVVKTVYFSNTLSVTNPSISSRGGDFDLFGEVCEFVFIRPNPTAGIQENLEGYLAQKWGADLIVGHPFNP